jgi:putative flavoprotein involved in K+ transport
MVQRSSTTIVGRKTLCDILCGDLYSEAAVAKGIGPERADLMCASIPYRPLADAHKGVCAKMQELDADILDRLRRRGFLIDFGEDGSGNFLKFLRAGKGYYFDCGASELIANGEVGLKVGQISKLSDEGVVMEDGDALPADAVVLATGYGPVNDLAAQFLGKEVTTRLGKVWGLGSGTRGDPGPWEGEIRNMWKPTQVEGLWVHGGNLQQNRSYSLYLALQLQARALGLETPVYGLQEVHHAA